jgi:hypothetical protein
MDSRLRGNDIEAGREVCHGPNIRTVRTTSLPTQSKAWLPAFAGMTSRQGVKFAMARTSGRYAPPRFPHDQRHGFTPARGWHRGRV